MMKLTKMIDTPEDRSKFERVYLEYRNLMYHAAYEILENVEDAEDAVHQAFLKVAENIEKIEEAVSPKTKSFLVTIVENRAIDVLRMKKKHPEVPYEDATSGLEFEYNSTDDLTRCMAKLSARYRQVIVLKHLHGFTNKEIAQILGLKERNVIQLEQRAKAKLREMCSSEGLL